MKESVLMLWKEGFVVIQTRVQQYQVLFNIELSNSGCDTDKRKSGNYDHLKKFHDSISLRTPLK